MLVYKRFPRLAEKYIKKLLEFNPKDETMFLASALIESDCKNLTELLIQGKPLNKFETFEKARLDCGVSANELCTKLKDWHDRVQKGGKSAKKNLVNLGLDSIALMECTDAYIQKVLSGSIEEAKALAEYRAQKSDTRDPYDFLNRYRHDVGTHERNPSVTMEILLSFIVPILVFATGVTSLVFAFGCLVIVEFYIFGIGLTVTGVILFRRRNRFDTRVRFLLSVALAMLMAANIILMALNASNFGKPIPDFGFKAAAGGYAVYGNSLFLSGEIAIPATYNDQPVVEIGASAFAGRNITAVYIPESITTIGAWAFENCHKLSSITIPATVTKIGTEAFKNADLTIWAAAAPMGDHYGYGWWRAHHVVWNAAIDFDDDGYAFVDHFTKSGNLSLERVNIGGVGWGDLAYSFNFPLKRGETFKGMSTVSGGTVAFSALWGALDIAPATQVLYMIWE
jgi:hypothetical protein